MISAGDRVLVIGPGSHSRSDRIPWVPEMDAMVGKVVTVNYAEGGDITRISWNRPLLHVCRNDTTSEIWYLDIDWVVRWCDDVRR